MTTGLKRLASFSSFGLSSPSPPMASKCSILPEKAPITSSYTSQVLMPSASRAKKDAHGSGVLKLVISSKPSSTIATVYAISFPFFSEISMLNFSSGRSSEGIFIIGSRIVVGSTTLRDCTPYKRIGKSFLICPCGWIIVKWTYTFGAISGVALNETFVVPSVASAQNVFITLLPDSRLTSMWLSAVDGMDSVI